MKKMIPYVLRGSIIITALSLVLTLVFELLKLLDIAGVCFIIFLVSGAAIICTTVAIAFIALYKKIRANGFRRTMIPLLKRFLVLSFALLLLKFVFRHQLLLLEAIIGSTVLALISIFDFMKSNSDDNNDPTL